MFPGPGYLHYKDGVVWLWHLLVNLCIYIYTYQILEFYLYVLHHNRTQKQLQYFLLNILQKWYSKIFWILWICLVDSIKDNKFNLLKLWCLSAWKKWTAFLTSFLRYCKGITTLLLWVLWGYFIMPNNNNNTTLQEALMTKVLKSTYRKLWSLSACKKSTSSLASFLRYCKDIVNLLLWEL